MNKVVYAVSIRQCVYNSLCGGVR